MSLPGRYFFLCLSNFLADGYIQICATANKLLTSMFGIIKFSWAMATHTFTLTHFKYSFDCPIFIQLSSVVFPRKKQIRKINRKQLPSETAKKKAWGSCAHPDKYQLFSFLFHSEFEIVFIQQKRLWNKKSSICDNETVPFHILI